MPTTTRNTVDAMLPPGTTVDDLSERELGELFQAVVEQTEAEGGMVPVDAPTPPAE